MTRPKPLLQEMPSATVGDRHRSLVRAALFYGTGKTPLSDEYVDALLTNDGTHNLDHLDPDGLNGLTTARLMFGQLAYLAGRREVAFVVASAGDQLAAVGQPLEEEQAARIVANVRRFDEEIHELLTKLTDTPTVGESQPLDVADLETAVAS